MFYLLKRQCQLRPLKGETGRFSGLLPSFAYLHAHSTLHPLHKPASCHPDVGQRKQRNELCSIFGKPPVADLGVPELALDNPKRMLHLGPHAGLELFGLFVERAPGLMLLRLTLTRAYGHMPIDARGCPEFCVNGAVVKF